jgi:hypothetical protein
VEDPSRWAISISRYFPARQQAGSFHYRPPPSPGTMIGGENMSSGQHGTREGKSGGPASASLDRLLSSAWCRARSRMIRRHRCNNPGNFSIEGLSDQKLTPRPGKEKDVDQVRRVQAGARPDIGRANQKRGVRKLFAIGAAVKRKDGGKQNAREEAKILGSLV